MLTTEPIELAGRAPPKWRASPVLLAAIFSVSLAGGLRLFHLRTAYDVFIDEISYLRVSQGVAQHFTFQLYGRPFLIHPPGFFLVEGAYLRLFPPGGDTIAQILAVRDLNVVLSVLTAGLLFASGYAVAGKIGGFIASILFAVDPYLIRISSWNMLEPLTLLFVITGALILLQGISHECVRWRTALGAGTAFGCALLTKETSVFVTLAPCAVLFVTGWAMRRRHSAAMATTAAGTYALYPVVLYFTGTIDPWLNEKFYDIDRLKGAIQETGFNQPGTESLWTAIQRNISIMGTSYFLFIFGGLATLVLLADRRPAQRYLAAVMVCAEALIGYAIVWGTLEEQMFFLLGVPCTLAIGIGSASMLDRLQARSRLRPGLSWTLAACAAGYVVLSGIMWSRIHLVPDTAMMDAIHWADSNNIPAGAAIAVTAEPPEFLISNHASGKWVTPDELRQNDVHYVLNSSKQVQGGYSYAGSDFFGWVSRHGEIVWKGNDRTYGSVVMYFISDLSGT